eukprot:gene51118-62511_t
MSTPSQSPSPSSPHAPGSTPASLAMEAESAITAKDLPASEAIFRAVFDQTTTGIAQTDLTGRFVLINNRFCDIAGRSREELLRLRMHDITHPEDLKANAAEFKALAEGTGPNFTVEKRYLRPDGAEIWVHNEVVAIRNEKGEVHNLMATVVDITESRRANELL